VIAFTAVFVGAALAVLNTLSFFTEQTYQSLQECGTPSEYPVCAEVPGQFDQIYSLIIIGAVLVIIGIFLALRFGRASKLTEYARG